MTVSPNLGALLHRSLRAYQIWGANTDVGKTVFSTILCGLTSKYRPNEKTTFLKPVSTGPLDEADDRCDHVPKFFPDVHAKTLFQFDLAVSPHLAAQVSEQETPSDKEIVSKIHSFSTRQASPSPAWLFVETAGGVHSPGPSRTTQADLYRPLRLPAILVGDAKLGGISQTISAFESLKLRGYDVELVLLFHEDRYQNYLYLTDYFGEHHSIPVQTAPIPPPRVATPSADMHNMATYYNATLPSLSAIPTLLSDIHNSRITRLETMATTASETIWYPFTQHKHLAPSDITAIDSAKDSHFDTFDKTPSTTKGEDTLLRPLFNASASWWTQGLGHGNPSLALSAAYAAGRYGHVMFAETIHEPALSLAETLLSGLRNPRLKRVFYSDNGSTAVEVAIKMALRASRQRYRWTEKEVGVLGLKGSYHGDTIGAMDCSEPGVFNEKVEWYRGRGGWLEGPGVRCERGLWKVAGREFGTLDEVFDVEVREGRGEVVGYEKDIKRFLEGSSGKFGALILEPVVLGAGGMVLVDPLFQRTLVKAVRDSPQLFAGKQSYDTPTGELDWSGLPVIFDEVFTGLYRLGRFSAASFLGVDPDISVHAKLLTGGLLPLSTTLASESIFNAFLSDDKSDALLHGHSYTAHAVGCQVALDSLKELKRMEREGDWDWATHGNPRQSDPGVGSRVWSVWSPEFVEWLSWQQKGGVDGAWALGSVVAIHMGGAGDSAGYKSNAAKGLQATLLRGSEKEGAVHSRVLGNVLYLMTGQKTSEDEVRRVERLVRRSL
ncbi:hypothetical protein OQA88_3190 [Cercophora sp. LCS_1]